MKEFPGLKILAALLIPLLFCACAVDKPPTGGPPDRSPLSVTGSMPVNASVNTSPQKIRIGFSHYVGKADLAKSIFFSPRIDDYAVVMHGKEADIRIYEPLKPNRTYTLTLRAPLKSLDENRQLEESWTLAFSTGPVLDQGSIEGRLWTNRLAPAQNSTVMAYATAPSSATPQPRPDYIAQSEPSGEFHFQHLAPGSYRIVATTGEVGNAPLNPKEETFAVTSAQTVHTGMSGLAMRFAPENLSANELASCRTLNNREIEITFKKSIPARSFDLSAIRIENIASGELLPVLGYFSESRSSEEETFHLLTAPMQERASYRLRFSPAGSPASELTFFGDTRTERYPELSVSLVPEDGADYVVPEMIRPDSGSAVELQCNLPVAESSVRQAVTLSLSGHGQEQPVPFTISRIDSRTFAISAADGFRQNKDYLVQVRPGVLKGLVGEPSKTVVVKSRFSTAGPEAYGEVSGSGRANAPAVIVEARRGGEVSSQRVVAKTGADGTFRFDFHDLPAGEYTIAGFIPSASGAISPMTRWNSGSVAPFAPSDPFVALTVTVRGGWTTEEVRLDIPSTRQSGPDDAKSPDKP